MAESSTTSSASGWQRYVMPSVADLIFLALLLTLLFTPLSRRLLGDAGIGWHIRTGQLILATHAIPRADPFSSTMGGKPWFAWEWLYDVAVGWLESHAGLNGVVWLTAVVIASVFAAAFRLLIRRGTDLIAALVLILLAISASTIHFLARPHVLTWLLTLAWFAILDASERDSDTRSRTLLWTLPLLMLFWVNLHGGFLLGFVLLAILWLSALRSWVKTKNDRIESAFEKIAARRRAIDLSVIALLSALASLVNPYGWNLYRHVFSYLSSRFLMNHIDEFRSPDFHGLAPRCFLILLLISIAAVAGCGRKLRLSGVLTLLFAVYAGLYASRNIPVSAILLVLIVGPLFRRDREFAVQPARRNFFARMSAVEISLRGHAWPALAVIVSCLLAVQGHARPNSLLDIQFDPARMPVAAVDYLQLNNIRGPVLAPDYWGGYLIYRMAPDQRVVVQRVVVDDRHDLYGEQFFKSYLKMIRVEPGWDDFLREHDACCLLLPRDSALAAIIATRPEWKQVYADNLALFFEKNR
jgi:hypothetical protein